MAEEFFFRAFFYRALRNRLRVWSSCLITSVVFASLHLQYVATPLVFVIIGAFAAVCCLVYEATGNLFTVIAIHAIFNTLATAGTDAGWVVPIAVGASVVAACVLIPRLARARALALPPDRAGPMKDRGALALVLHSHMPYVEGFGTWPFGEEWLWEAVSCVYLPLIDCSARSRRRSRWASRRCSATSSRPCPARRASGCWAS